MTDLAAGSNANASLVQTGASAQSSAYSDGLRVFVFRAVFPARIGDCSGGFFSRDFRSRDFIRSR